MNASYWNEKIARNQRRDEDTTRQLAAGGWTVIRVWEHDDPDVAARRIELAVRAHTLPGR